MVPYIFFVHVTKYFTLVNYINTFIQIFFVVFLTVRNVFNFGMSSTSIINDSRIEGYYLDTFLGLKIHLRKRILKLKVQTIE